MTNPFFITGTIPDKYFCDRDQETEKIIVQLENQSHILLTSSRRIGKTQLIRHIFEQDLIKDRYHTFYVDIYSTGTLRELVFFLGREIYRRLVPGEKKALDLFLGTIKSIAAAFSIDPISGGPRMNLQIGDISMPELTLEEIFEYLEKADKRCVFAIDEFQQIARYPEKNTEALLRTHIQSMNNCCFIFSGSDRHILERMFSSYNRPFYSSAVPIYLERIDREKYIDFAVRCFAEYDITISRDVSGYCYDKFDGFTYHVHKVFHDIFAYAKAGQTVTREMVDRMSDAIIEENAHGYNETMAGLGIVPKQLLVAIAKSGPVGHLTSGAFVKKNALPSASSTQKAIKVLLDNQLVTYIVTGSSRQKVYQVSDKFFEKWLSEMY